MRIKLLRFATFVLSFFILASAVSNIALAKKIHPVLQCLADEELKIHKNKNKGPQYFLNQQIFNHWVSIAHLKIRPEFIREICHHPHFPPSLALTYMILRYQVDLFEYPKEAVEKAGQQALGKELVEQIAEVWPQYLAGLQTTLPYPKNSKKVWKNVWPCLEELIPQIKNYLDRFMYLEEELGTQKLMSDKTEFQAVFEKLKSLDTIEQRCKILIR